jgi:hypothetical protein
MAPWCIALPGTSIVQIARLLWLLLTQGSGRDHDFIIGYVFIVFVQPDEESCLTCATTTLIRPSTCTFFLHPMHGVGNVERLFKRSDTR